MLITVNVSALKNALRKTKAAYIEELAAAQAGFLITVREEAERLMTITEVPEEHIWVNLEPPRDHTGEFDRILRVIESASSGVTVQLTDKEADSYLNGNFDWLSSWRNANRLYASKVM